MAEFTADHVEKATEAMLSAKAKAKAPGATAKARAAYQEAAVRLTEVRRTWRAQEEAAGRRQPVPPATTKGA